MEVLAFNDAVYPMVGEGSLMELVELRAGGSMRDEAEVACDIPVDGLTQRIRCEAGAGGGRVSGV